MVQVMIMMKDMSSSKELYMVGDDIIQRIKYLLNRHNTEVTIFINRKKQTLIENLIIFTLYSVIPSYRNNKLIWFSYQFFC